MCMSEISKLVNCDSSKSSVIILETMSKLPEFRAMFLFEEDRYNSIHSRHLLWLLQLIQHWELLQTARSQNIWKKTAATGVKIWQITMCEIDKQQLPKLSVQPSKHLMYGKSVLYNIFGKVCNCIRGKLMVESANSTTSRLVFLETVLQLAGINKLERDSSSISVVIILETTLRLLDQANWDHFLCGEEWKQQPVNSHMPHKSSNLKPLFLATFRVTRGFNLEIGLPVFSLP